MGSVYLLSVGKGLNLSLDYLCSRDGLGQTYVLQLASVELDLHTRATGGRQTPV